MKKAKDSNHLKFFNLCKGTPNYQWLYEKQLWSLNGNQNSAVVYIIPTFWWIPSSAVKPEISSERAGSTCIKGWREGGREPDDRGSSISFGVNKYPVWVICCFSPTEQFSLESQSASSPQQLWHVGLLLPPCQTQIHLCSDFKETVLWNCWGRGGGGFILQIWRWALFFSCFRFFPRRSGLAVHTSADSDCS